MRDRFLLAGGSLLAAAILAELILAVAAPQIHRLPDVWTHDRILGWRHRPGAEGRLVTPEFDVRYRIDGYGRRQHAAVGADTASARRIQLYGDSFAEGWGVEVEQGLAARLEAELIAGGSPARVENYGVAGYGTDQELLLFDADGAERAPDVVVCLFYTNDLWNNVSRHGIGAQRGAKPFFRSGPGLDLFLSGVPILEPPPRREPAYAVLAQHSHLASLVLAALQPPPPQAEAAMETYYGALYGPGDGFDAAKDGFWDLTARLLGLFAERAERAGARFLVVVAPAIVQIEVDDWRTKRDLHQLTGDYDLSKPGRVLADLSRLHGFEVLDLYADFRAAADAGQDLYFDDSHWTPAGHALAARRVAAALGAALDAAAPEAAPPSETRDD